ncbi:angiopoietin-4-like [Anopheles darlingi]|uniref:angiopoietin-4-like n=1 Tax=Anopheles darlingi TaxID=43151 RepID=UPI0020FFFB42|nr:angiopoietin-4-like [Anopheles darlingi]
MEKLLNRFDDVDRELLELQMELNEHREEVELPRTTSPTTPQPTTTPRPTVYTSCKDVPANASGVYHIRIHSLTAPFKVYCEMDSFEGGWIVMQHRFDGSVDFYRNWDEYRDGFGELDNEFWLGLEHVHQLTTRQKHELIVEVKDFEGNYGRPSRNELQ